jgi:hypothetical protein
MNTMMNEIGNEYEVLYKLVKNIHSLRLFKPELVPDDLIDNEIDAARRAPAGFNWEPCEFGAVEKSGSKTKDCRREGPIFGSIG